MTEGDQGKRTVVKFCQTQQEASDEGGYDRVLCEEKERFNKFLFFFFTLVYYAPRDCFISDMIHIEEKPKFRSVSDEEMKKIEIVTAKRRIDHVFVANRIGRIRNALLHLYGESIEEK